MVPLREKALKLEMRAEFKRIMITSREDPIYETGVEQLLFGN
jgi:hypothetical protein